MTTNASDMADHDTGTDQLLCAARERVATITLNRPQARNALTPELTTALRKAIAWAGSNPDL